MRLNGLIFAFDKIHSVYLPHKLMMIINGHQEKTKDDK